MDHPFVENDESSGDQPDEAPKRRRWLTVMVSLVVVILAIGAALFVAASHYQPLSQTPGGGYGSQILTSNGALATHQYTSAKNDNIVWTEPSGTFHVDVIVTINNVQRFPVTIEKVMAPPNPSGTSDVRVFFDSKPKLIGAYGYTGGAAFKPTSLASEGSLQLVVHWNQECVPTSAASGATTYTTLPVEYSFMGFHHTVTVPIDGVTISPRTTC
jgi:hypothetical protein